MNATEIREVIRETIGEVIGETRYPMREGRGVDMTEAEVRADIDKFDKDQKRVCEKLADVFVGPKLSKTSTEDKIEAREAARKVFIEGRGGL